MALKKASTFREEFFLETPTHIALNNAGITLLPKKTVKVLHDLTESFAKEGAFLEPIFAEYIKAKTVLATFLGAKPSQIAWTQNCSAAISLVANGLKPKANEEIVIFENDYPANFYPWAERSKKHGSLLRIVPAEKDLQRNHEKILSLINKNTTIVAVSLIQSDCGYLMDISQIVEAAHKVGAIIVVDAIQSLGVLPLNFEKSGIDILCGGSHKWLCGPVGAGFLVAREEVLSAISPSLHGATNYGSYLDAPDVEKKCFDDARKFEQGTMALHSILGLKASLELIMSYGVSEVQDYSHAMRAIIENGAKELGFSVFGNAKQSGPQISFYYPQKSLNAFSEALNKEKISHALRPVPKYVNEEEKVLRLSPYAYNTDEEIHFTLSVLKKARDNSAQTAMS